MPTTQETPAAHLRKIGLLVLLAGVAIAAIIYALGPLETSSDPNSLQTQYYKNQELETQRLWGNGGSLILAVTRTLKQASTYSIIVIVISAVISAVCFYHASHPNHSSETINARTAEPTKRNLDA
jgi:hypothetical protein